MKIISHLNFDGQCEEAFKFYAQVLGGQIIAMMAFDGMPGCDEMSEADKSKIMHARLVVGDQQLMGADAMSMFPYEGVKGTAVTLAVDTAEEADRLYNGLSEGGTVGMPIQETFFANRFGMLTDRYGVPWMVINEKARG
jgi:PhnB protein